MARREGRSGRGKGTGAAAGHPLAVLCVCVWGVSVCAARALLSICTPVQLAALTFTSAYLILLIVRPKFSAPKHLLSELRCVVMGLAGFAGYWFLSVAAFRRGGSLYASSVFWLVPPVTMIAMCVAGRKDRMRALDWVAAAVGAVGSFLVCYNGEGSLVFNEGVTFVALALGAVLCRAVFAVLSDGSEAGNPIALTRRMLFWAAAASVVAMFLTDGLPGFEPLIRVSSLVWLAVLGMIGCGACGALWLFASSRAGIEKTSCYMYFVPAFALLFSAFALKQGHVSFYAWTGMAISAIGVALSFLAG